MYVKDRLRRSMMFVPGNNPGMIRDAHIYGADSIMFDLEDSVAYTEKDSARFLVYNALKTLHFGSKETVVRINDLSSGLGIKDLEAVVRAGVQVVRLPKTDSAQDVIDCEREIERIERESGIPVGTTGMMAAIESANGVLHAAEIAHASDRLIGIALGAEDYVTDLKTTRSDGIELLFARCMILNAARAAGIAALLQARCEKLTDIPEKVDFFDALPDYDVEFFTNKKSKTNAEVSKAMLEAAIPALEAISDWTVDAIHDTLIDLAAKLEVKNATLMWPVRIAAAGKLVTPGGAVEICHLLGKDETLRRLRLGLDKLN